MIGAEQERELIARAQSGDSDAAGELLEAHKGFWFTLARRERGDVEDTMQEILLVAFQCIPSFDLSHRVRFLTFAGPKVRWHLGTMRGTGGLIRTPTFTNLQKLALSLRKKSKRARRTESLDAPLSDGRNSRSTLVASGDDVIEECDRAESIERVNWAIDQLDARLATVLRGRMDEQTLSEIGARLGVTKERIRQIESQAVERVTELLYRRCRQRVA